MRNFVQKNLKSINRSGIWVLSFLTIMVMSMSAGLADGHGKKMADDPHSAVYMEEAYPSASKCGQCHTQIFDEWASSNHAYASISPMFHKFEQAVNGLTQGTMGSFCVRCHQQVGTQRGEERWLPLWERSNVASEGITCITCHRVKEYYGKVNGERHIEPGDIHQPVYGTLEDTKFNEVLAKADEHKIVTSEGGRGNKVHDNVIEFETLDKSEFCVSCHQVAVNLGIKLEVVWEQYRDSPAFKKGVTCQDCHMGKVPGVAAGYETAPSAIVNGVEINPGRKHANHAFFGPGYPIAHPGVFPVNGDAERWDMEDWLKFDYRAKWGSEDFEDEIADAADFVDTFDGELEGLGANNEAITTLHDVDLSVGRGELGLHTQRARTRLLTKLEVLDGAVDVDEATAIAAKLPALVKELEENLGSSDAEVKELFQKLHAGVAVVQQKVQDAEGYEDAYEGMIEVLEGLPEKVTAADVEAVKSKYAALRAAMPGTTPEFQEPYKSIKKKFGIDFPFVWSSPDDREEAWAVVEANFESLEEKRELRRQVMENGSRIDGPYFNGDLKAGEDLSFKYTVTNTDEGHNLPSGSLGAQPEIWLNVALTGPDGENIWESGYVDSNGDFGDNHSLGVATGEIPFDDQLFSLQTKFLTTNVKGTDREMYLPVSFDIDQRPQLRPSNVPSTILNHPPFVRMEGRSIPPLGYRDAKYTVPSELIKKPGKYKLSVRMRSRAEPIYFMKFVGATDDMIQSMNEWMLDIHPYTVEFEVK